MLIVCLLIFLIVLGITITQLISGKKNEFNLEKPKERIIKLDGKEYNFTITKYNPPYYHARLLNSK